MTVIKPVDFAALERAMGLSISTEEQMEELRRQRDADRAIHDASSGFCTVDLADWVDLATAAGVPHIPTEIVADIGVSDLTMFDVEEGPHIAELKRFCAILTPALEARVGTHMARWSCCSMADLKYGVNSGNREWCPEFLRLYPDDFRAFDLISEYPRTRIAAHVRPWVPLRTRTSDAGIFALEARVFVSSDRVDGISAYYPQCPLTWDDADATRLIAQSFDYASRMIEVQSKPLIVPQVPALHLKTGNAWTADFVMTESGEVLFLEGGPPHTPRWGAHPCCFEGRAVCGVALAPAEAGQ